MIEALKFTEYHNILFSSLICLLIFGVFINANNLYLKTKDIRFAFIAAGFLMGGFFELFHISYEYIDSLIHKNMFFYDIRFVFLTLSNISMSSSILIALIHKPKREPAVNKIWKFYLFAILTILGIPIAIELFKILNFSVYMDLSERLLVNNPSIKVVDNALYILSLFLLFDIKKVNNQKIFSYLFIGLFILGVGQLYVITSDYLESLYRFYMHFLKIAGVFLILVGQKEVLQSNITKSFRYKLITYPPLIFLCFYIVFVSLSIVTTGAKFLQESQYLFLCFFLIAVAVNYILSNSITSQISAAIKFAENISLDKKPSLIPFNTNDEFQILIEKFNESTEHIIEKNNELLIKQNQILQANSREKLLRKISDSIRKTIDISEIFNLACNEIAVAFNVNRVGIYEFPSTDERWDWILRGEYKSHDGLIGLDDKSINKKTICELWCKHTLIEAKPLIINNMYRHDLPEPFREIYITRGVKSIIGLPIKSDKQIWGLFALSSYFEFRDWTEQEISLLEGIATQLYIAINQAELVESIKKQAERETLLRSIMETIRSSLELNQLKTNIVEGLGKTFNADRCFIRLYSHESAFSVGAEYLSSKEISSVIGYVIDKEVNKFVISNFLANKAIIVPDVELIKTDPLFNEAMIGFYNDLNCKSSYGFPIFWNNQMLGAVVLQYVKQTTALDNASIELIKLISSQAGIAIYQAKLFAQNTETAQHERLLKEVVSIIKENYDINEAFSVICKKISPVFNVQRVSLVNYSNLHNEELILAEFRNEGVKGPKESNYFDSRLMDYWIEVYINNEKNCIIDDISISDLPAHLKIIFESINVKSLVSLPVKIGNDNLKSLLLYDYKSSRHWSEKEIATLNAITEQISIAIREKNIYSQERFLTNITHELKTPVAIINSYTEALINRDANKSEMAQKFLNIIKNNIDRLTNIIDDLLSLSVIEYDISEERQNFSPAELIEVIKTAKEICMDKAKSKNINININYEIPVYANINSFLIQQALINLINNAINYSNENTEIIISAEENYKESMISVKDFGCGIDKEQMENIFKRFYRVDKSRSRETGGSGLGLSIVQKIAEVHGGSVSVKSAPEEGSTFVLHFNK